MVDHFSKYGWAKWIIDKKSSTIIKTLKSWLATHNKPEMIQSDNGPEFTSREFKHFLAKLNINQNFGMPYNPKSQGVVESFNNTVPACTHQVTTTRGVGVHTKKFLHVTP